MYTAAVAECNDMLKSRRTETEIAIDNIKTRIPGVNPEIWKGEDKTPENRSTTRRKFPGVQLSIVNFNFLYCLKWHFLQFQHNFIGFTSFAGLFFALVQNCRVEKK